MRRSSKPALSPACRTRSRSPTGGADEARRRLRGSPSPAIVDGAPGPLTDGLGITVDDGTGPVRAVIGPTRSWATRRSPATSSTVRGPLGQRDSSGTGVAGLSGLRDARGRVRGRRRRRPRPRPRPRHRPRRDPDARRRRQPRRRAPARRRPRPRRPPRPRAPTPTPTATPAPMSLVRRPWPAHRDRGVRHRAVVTAEAGRTGTPQLVAIGDATGGIAVRLCRLEPPHRPRGTFIVVTGPLAAPYGQLEIRPAAGGIATDGVGALPDPVDGRRDRSRRGHRWTAPGRDRPPRDASRRRPRAATSASILERPGTASVKVMSRRLERHHHRRRSRSARRIASSASAASERPARAPSTAIASGSATAPTSSGRPAPTRARAGRRVQPDAEAIAPLDRRVPKPTPTTASSRSPRPAA